MHLSVASATTPAPRIAGRERSCEQCATIYRAPRASSRYCTDRCKKRAQRGSLRGSPKASTALRTWLIKRGYVGKLSPWDSKNRSGAAERWGVTVPLAHVLAELSEATARIKANGLRPLLPSYTEPTLKSALAAAGLDHRFPDAIQRQLGRA
jgi:hypothetical protein